MMYTTKLTTRMFSLRDEIDRLIENAASRNQAGYSDWNPAVDVTETNDALTFAIEIPGLTEKDVDVSAENGILTVRGERSAALKEGEDSRFHLAERRSGTFLRRFQLPPGVDSAKIEAMVECGLLEVRVPHAALLQSTKIHITGAGEPATGVSGASASLKKAVPASTLPHTENRPQTAGANGGSPQSDLKQGRK
jgi:HSP20 family protein